MKSHIVRIHKILKRDQKVHKLSGVYFPIKFCGVLKQDIVNNKILKRDHKIHQIKWSLFSYKFLCGFNAKQDY